MVALSVLGGASLVAFAFAFVGGLIGFVFAIPRSRQEQPAVQPLAQAGTPRRLSDYAANTNLEQISDWLTKILVGIGLTQFNDMVSRFRLVADALVPLLSRQLDWPGSARSVVLSLMTYFMVWGFFFAYLFTRLWLPKALVRAEREEESQGREAALRALEGQVYDSLYQPGGFGRAIEDIQAYQGKPGALPSPRLWLYLASAYGQKHAAERGLDDASADEARRKAVEAAREALRLDPGQAGVLRQLYEGQDPREDDLASLKPDATLDELLKK